MTEKDYLVLFAKALYDAIPNGMQYQYCYLEIKRQIGMTGIGPRIVALDGKISSLRPQFDYESAINGLYTITQTQPPIHKDWNKAVFTLYPDGKADIEYIWDAEWQARIDKYNEEAKRKRNKGKM